MVSTKKGPASSNDIKDVVREDTKRRIAKSERKPGLDYYDSLRDEDSVNEGVNHGLTYGKWPKIN